MRRAVTWLTLFAFTWAQIPAWAQHHQEGLDAGRAANATLRPLINPTDAAQTVPGYGTTTASPAAENPSTRPGEATSRLADCQRDPTSDPSCDAIATSYRSANASRPALSSQDPMVRNARAVGASPRAALGDLSAYYAGCSIADTATSPTETKKCLQYASGANLACGRRLTIEVERATNCTPGDWIAESSVGKYALAIQCRASRTGVVQHFRLRIAGDRPIYFDADVTAPTNPPRRVATFGSTTTSDGTTITNGVWFTANQCAGDRCSVTAVVGPEALEICNAPIEPGQSCPLQSIFVPRYADCPGGSIPGTALSPTAAANTGTPVGGSRASAVETVIDDMRLPNEGRLLNVPNFGWATGPGNVIMGNVPNFSNFPAWAQESAPAYIPRGEYNRVIPWFVAFEGTENRARNVRVHIGSAYLWIQSRSTRQWTTYGPATGFGGTSCTQTGNYTASSCTDSPGRQEPAGGTSFPIGNGRNYHGWWDLGLIRINPTDIGAVVVTYTARLVVDNPALPDDRSAAQILLHTGADYYPEVGFQFGSFPAPGVGVSATRLLSSDWRSVSMATLSDVGVQAPGGGITAAQFRSNPPPLEQVVVGGAPGFSANYCYVPSATATRLQANHPGTGVSTYWTQGEARELLGYDVNPAFGGRASRLTLSFERPLHVVAERETWVTDCPAGPAGGRCRQIGAERCVEGSETRLISGSLVTRGCWRYSAAMSCDASGSADACTDLAAAGCTATGTACRQTDPATGVCAITERTFNCPRLNATQTAVSGCPSNVFCLGTNCFDTAYVADADFARSITMMEGGREAGVYLDPDEMKVFSGAFSRCQQRYDPLGNQVRNCCKPDSSGAGYTNQRVFGRGSPYMYDSLFTWGNAKFVYQAFAAAINSSEVNGSFSSYGVTVTVGADAVETLAGTYDVSIGPTTSTADAAGTVVYASEGGEWAISFNPWAIVIAVIVQFLIHETSCDEFDGMWAMQAGAKLCVKIGTYCRLRHLPPHRSQCREEHHAHCCFNSLLSRIVNEQGRSQLGKGWGTDPRAPDCSGFSIAELQRLDFAKIDFTEFYASIQPTTADPGARLQRANDTVGDCYFGQGACTRAAPSTRAPTVLANGGMTAPPAPARPAPATTDPTTSSDAAASAATGSGTDCTAPGAVPNPLRSRTARVLYLGDSMTYGDDTNPRGFRSYRGPLAARLGAAGIQVEAVGTRDSAGANSGFPGAYIGPGGSNNNVYDQLPSIIAASRPDVIVVAMGWNSVFHEPSLAPAKYQALVARLRELAPNAAIVVATLSPQGGLSEQRNGELTPGYAAFNATARGIGNSSPTDSVYLADLASAGFTAADSFDGLHWTQSGGDRAAAVIFNALLSGPLAPCTR